MGFLIACTVRTHTKLGSKRTRGSSNSTAIQQITGCSIKIGSPLAETAESADNTTFDG
ncbi:MAG: hypothetical protein JWR34_4821 [Mycobacterium sp.]|nr:hypothetical protein [Mycobacterium sp.]